MNVVPSVSDAEVWPPRLFFGIEAAFVAACGLRQQRRKAATRVETHDMLSAT